MTQPWPGRQAQAGGEEGRNPQSPGGPFAESPGDSWLGTLQALTQELPGLFSDRVELLALELSRAGRALARIVAWVVAISIVGVTAWLALWAGLVVALIDVGGLHWALALLPVLLINLAAALLGLRQVKSLATQVGLPATRRHLTLARGAASTPASGAGGAPVPDPHDHETARP